MTQFKSIRQTVDLPPEYHAQFARWKNDTAALLGRTRVSSQEALATLVAVLLCDDEMSERVRDNLAGGGGFETGQANRPGPCGWCRQPGRFCADPAVAPFSPGLAVVYYIQTGAHVKIGFSTNLHKRMQELQPERVLAVEPGLHSLEAARHHQFRALRDSGEWFRAAPELLEHAAAARAMQLPGAVVPASAVPR